MPNNTQAMQDDLHGDATGDWGQTKRVGFCQECGRVLTSSTLRHVDSGTFCEGCAPQRAGQDAWQSVYGGSTSAEHARNQQPRGKSGPRPRLAAWLGFMPGVGAMYNGQYGKAAMHLAVFVALLAMADHVSDVLYWLVWGWVFYQVFDAYHTAAAQRDGQPLPDPFGFNDVGGRFFGGVPRRPAVLRQASPFQTVPPRSTSTYAAAESRTADAWNGENPYNAPYRWHAPPPPNGVPFDLTAQATRKESIHAPTQPDILPTPTPLEGTRRFPLAALLLIGLGGLFLLGNLWSGWHFSGEWVTIAALGVLTLWSGAHRWMRSRMQAPNVSGGRTLLIVLGFPAVLFISLLLLTLDALHLATIARTWPLVLVIWGVVLFLQRSLPPPIALPSAVFPPVPPGTLPEDFSRNGGGSQH